MDWQPGRQLTHICYQSEANGITNCQIQIKDQAANFSETGAAFAIWYRVVPVVFGMPNASEVASKTIINIYA